MNEFHHFIISYLISIYIYYTKYSNLISFNVLQKVLQLAIKAGVPFIYISANSGARIGLSEEVKHSFKVAWVDKDKPDKVSYPYSLCNNVMYTAAIIGKYMEIG